MIWCYEAIHNTFYWLLNCSTRKVTEVTFISHSDNVTYQMMFLGSQDHGLGAETQVTSKWAEPSETKEIEKNLRNSDLYGPRVEPYSGSRERIIYTIYSIRM